MQGTPEYDQQQMIAMIQYQQQVIEEQEVMMTEQDRQANAMLERRRMTVDVRNQLINGQKTTIQELRERMSAELIESQQQTIDQLTQQRDCPPEAQVDALIAALPVEQLPGVLERLVARLPQRGRPQRQT
jgi:phospholipid N-methyltransferase